MYGGDEFESCPSLPPDKVRFGVDAMQRWLRIFALISEMTKIGALVVELRHDSRPLQSDDLFVREIAKLDVVGL